MWYNIIIIIVLISKIILFCTQSQLHAGLTSVDVNALIAGGVQILKVSTLLLCTGILLDSIN